MYRKSIALLLFLIVCGGFALAESADPAIEYIGIASKVVTIRSAQSTDAESIGYYRKGDKVEILSYDPSWLTVHHDGMTGYILRHLVTNVKPLSQEIPHYGTMLARDVAVLREDTPLHSAADIQASVLTYLSSGARVALTSIQDGWAQVIYNRQYGYIHASALTQLKPVSIHSDTARVGTPLSAYCTFYSTAQTEMNIGRVSNIQTACDYIKAITIEPGFIFSFNDIAGPFRANRGYKQAPIFINGQSMPGSGGGTCQVSTTLYNALIALPQITIVFSRPHGPSGAKYVPHGVDAAVGADNINLVFRNDFPFPIRIEATAHDGVLFTAICKAQ